MGGGFRGLGSSDLKRKKKKKKQRKRHDARRENLPREKKKRSSGRGEKLFLPKNLGEKKN